MNNEEKILSAIENLTEVVTAMQGVMTTMQVENNARFDKLEQGQVKLEQGQVSINTRLTRMENTIEEIKEHAEITREATNILLNWAEQTARVVNIPLYDSAD